jgi:hypothetical protein
MCPELCLLIVEYLDDRDVKNLRLVCRHFQKLSMEQFGVRFFTHLFVSHHKCSVAKFLQIASHKELCLFVSTITVNVYGVQMDAHNQPIDCLEWESNFQTALRQFQCLKIVELDNVYPAASDDPTTLHCGWGNIDDKSTKTRCCCVFPAALNALRDFKDLTEIYLRISTKKRHYGEDDEDDEDEDDDDDDDDEDEDDDDDAKFCLWLNSTSWRDHWASKVTVIELIRIGKKSNAHWVSQLQLSIQMSKEFYCIGNVTDDTLTKVYWPRLNTINLCMSDISEVSLLQLFETYKATLTRVFLNMVELTTGTWLEPLRSITKMEQLRHADLRYLSQNNGGFDAGQIPDSFFETQQVFGNLVLDTRQSISDTASFLQFGVWTVYGNGRSPIAPWVVDFRLLKAQLANEITVFRLGLQLGFRFLDCQSQPSWVRS